MMPASLFISAYQIPMTFCMPRLTAAMDTQQHRPMKMGLPPVRTSFTMSVFRPMAAIAIMMKNLLSSLNGENTLPGTPRAVEMVVISEASTKKSMKKGNTLRSEKQFS